MLFKHYKLIKRKRNHNFFNYLFFKYHRIFFGSLIFKGKKLWASNLFLKLKYNLKIKEGVEPNLLFFFSMINISPTVLLFPLKIGGKVEGVPLPISLNKKLIFATK
jgi:ribosomal protein S7